MCGLVGQADVAPDPPGAPASRVVVRTPAGGQPLRQLDILPAAARPVAEQRGSELARSSANG